MLGLFGSVQRKHLPLFNRHNFTRRVLTSALTPRNDAGASLPVLAPALFSDAASIPPWAAEGGSANL
jgi:hypothetical protein